MNRLTTVAGALVVLCALAVSVFGGQQIEVTLGSEAGGAQTTATSKDLLLILPEKFFRPKDSTTFSTPYLAELYYTTDGGTTWQSYGLFKDLNKPFEFTAEGEGRYGFFVTLLDRKGNYDVMPSAKTVPQLVVLVDWTPPEVTLDAPKGGETVGTTPLDIKWTAKDLFIAASPISIDYSLDGGKTWKTIVNEGENSGGYQWAVPAGTNGRMLVRVTAVDEVGHGTSAMTASPVLVDTQAPTAAVTGPLLAAGESIKLDVKTGDGDGSGVAEVKLFSSDNNGAAWTPAGKAGASGTLEFKAPTGSYGLFACAVDRAGNAGAEPKPGDAPQISIQIDTKAPLVRLKSLYNGGFISGDTQVPVQWEAVTPQKTERNVSIFLSPDGGNTWSLIAREIENSGCFLWDVPAINSSNCIIKVAVKDASGATSESQSAKTFTIDSTRPTSAIGVTPSAASQAAANIGAILSGNGKSETAAPPAAGVAAPATTGAGETLKEPQKDEVTGRYQTTPAPEEPWLKEEKPYTGVVAPDTTPEGVLKAAFAAYKAGQIAMAKEYFKEAAALDPKDARPHAALGKIYAREAGFNYTAKKEAFEAALYEFDKALELGGDDADVYNDKGYVLLAAKRTGDAEAAFRKATGLGSKPIYWCNLGMALMKLGKRDEASGAFAKALEADASMKEANFYMAELSFGDGKWTDARKYYSKAADGYGVESQLGKVALAGIQKCREKLGEVEGEPRNLSIQQKLDKIR